MEQPCLRGIPIDKSKLITYAIIFEIILVLLSVFLDYISDSARIYETLVFELSAIFLGFGNGLVLILVSLIIWYDRGERLRWLHFQYMQIVEALRPVVSRAVVSMNARDIVLVSVAAGIGEELLFRGVLQSWLGIVGTSIIFGALHALTYAYFVIAVLLSLYLGWIYSIADNLWAPIVMHTLYDIYAFYVLRYIYRN